MTKVECPGPGFKGLKWKWIQNHAKEQQEREKERLAVQQVQLPGPAVLPHCQQQEAGAIHSTEPPLILQPCLQRESLDCQSGVGCGLPQEAFSNGVTSQAGVKVDAADPAVLPLGPCAAPVRIFNCEERVKLKEELESKEVQDHEGLVCPAPSAPTTAAVDLESSAIPDLATTAAGAVGASVNTSAAATSVVGTVLEPQAGGGVAPSLAIAMTGFMRRKSVDVGTSMLAAPFSLSPSTAASPPALITSTVEVTHGTGLATGTTTTQVAGPASGVPAAMSCIPTPAAAPAAAPQTFVMQQPGAGPSIVPPLVAGASRVRLPPARAPSITIANVTAKGGDDFESMFTPLSSLPVVKSETPRAVVPSRTNSLVSGAQPILPVTAAGSAAQIAAAVTAASDAGNHNQGSERKAPSKKASRVQDARNNIGQPSVPGSLGGSQERPELMELDQAPTYRSRTPVTQISPGTASAPVITREPPSAVTIAMGTTTTATGKTQPPLQLQQEQQAQLQSAHPQPVVMQSQQQQQQRAATSKHVKEGSKLRDSGEGLTGVAAAGPVSAVATVTAGGTRGGVSADKLTAPASAGSTPAAAPAYSGGEVGERKRPRTEGSKPKAATYLAGDALGCSETHWPYGETLADRIKRAKRATTSSSDQDGHHSHGGSAERWANAAHVGQGGLGGEGYANVVGAGSVRYAEDPPPRPAVSAEAQSRGSEPATAGKSCRQGPHVTTGTGGSGAPGITGGGGKQQERHQVAPVGQGKSFGRAEDSLAPRPSRNGGLVTERPPEQLVQNTAANLRMSGGGAVTDSSGGGGCGPGVPQRGTGPSTGGLAAASAQAPPGTTSGAGIKRAAADMPLSSRRQVPLAKVPRSDPHPPRPNQFHGQERRRSGPPETAPAAAIAGSGRTGAALPPPPSSKPTHRASSGTRVGAKGPADGTGPLGKEPGQAPAPTMPSPPPGRPGCPGESDMPAAGSCKGPVVVGSRGSKDGDKGACGPRHAGNAMDAVCGGTGGGTGGGGAGAAATTTTEPKTDSDTRTSRVVECFFEFDSACRVPGGSASISGLGSTGSLPGGHSLAARLGSSRFFGGTAAVAPPLPRSSGANATAMALLLDLGKIRSFKELWTQLAALYDGTMPDEMDSKMIYLDEEGDWIMVTPDEPWSSVAAAATKVLVTNRT